MGLRRTYQLDNVTNFLVVSLDWTPLSLSIVNVTPFAIYVNVGTISKPSQKSCTEIVLPFCSATIDCDGSRDFYIAIDNSSALNFPFAFPVTCKFSTGGGSNQSPISTTLQNILGFAYDNKIINLIGSDLIAFIALEDISGTVATDLVSNNNWTYGNSNVTLNQVGIGDGKPSVNFGGAANGQVTPPAITLANLNAAGKFNPSEGTISVWLYITAAIMGTVTGMDIAFVGADGSNYYGIQKPAANVIQNQLARGGTFSTLFNFAYTGDKWVNITFSWSVSNNQERLYNNGVLVGGAPMGGTWAGVLAATYTQIASFANSLYTNGNIAKFMLAKRALSDAEILQIAQLT